MVLEIDVEKVKHPYADEPSSSGEQWHKIRIYIMEGGLLVKEIIAIEWDLNVLIEWLMENEHAILNQFPPEFIKCKNIAKGVADFYDGVDPDDEYTIDLVYDYRLKHSLRFALRGTDIKDVYIGLNKEKSITVSSFNDKEDWCFVVGLDNFFKEVHKMFR